MEAEVERQKAHQDAQRERQEFETWLDQLRIKFGRLNCIKKLVPDSFILDEDQLLDEF